VKKTGPGFVWFHTGTPDSLVDAADFARELDKEHGIRIACPEEIAFDLGRISSKELERQSAILAKSDYGKYLARLELRGRTVASAWSAHRLSHSEAAFASTKPNALNY
jgi:dTDP-glucose pyrophosphorylase